VILILISFLIFLLPELSYAQDKHPIDVAEERCIAKDSNTAGMSNCAYEARQMWDAELNKYYQLLMKEMNQDQKNRLREAQLAWIKFRDAEFNNIHSFYATRMGTMYLNLESADKLAIVKQRAVDLRNFYQLLTSLDQ